MHERRLARARRPHDRGEAGRRRRRGRCRRARGPRRRPTRRSSPAARALTTACGCSLAAGDRGGTGFLGDSHDDSCPEGAGGTIDGTEMSLAIPWSSRASRGWGQPPSARGGPERAAGRSASRVAHGHVAVLGRDVDGARRVRIGAHVRVESAMVGRRVDAVRLAGRAARRRSRRRAATTPDLRRRDWRSRGGSTPLLGAGVARGRVRRRRDRVDVAVLSTDRSAVTRRGRRRRCHRLTRPAGHRPRHAVASHARSVYDAVHQYTTGTAQLGIDERRSPSHPCRVVGAPRPLLT